MTCRSRRRSPIIHSTAVPAATPANHSRQRRGLPHLRRPDRRLSRVLRQRSDGQAHHHLQPQQTGHVRGGGEDATASRAIAKAAIASIAPWSLRPLGRVMAALSLRPVDGIRPRISEATPGTMSQSPPKGAIATGRSGRILEFGGTVDTTSHKVRDRLHARAWCGEWQPTGQTTPQRGATHPGRGL